MSYIYPLPVGECVVFSVGMLHQFIINDQPSVVFNQTWILPATKRYEHIPPCYGLIIYKYIIQMIILKAKTFYLRHTNSYNNAGTYMRLLFIQVVEVRVKNCRRDASGC